jgi:hypothetical protein
MIKKYAKKMGWNLQFFYGSKLKTWGTTLFSLFSSNWGTQFWPIPLWGYVIGKNGRIFSMDILDEMYPTQKAMCVPWEYPYHYESVIKWNPL